jgi:putative membrane protein
MITRFLFAATAAPLFVLAACSDAEPDPAATEETVAAGTEPAADPSLPVVARGFVAMAAASDLFEIQSGMLAQANGKSQAVKDFGAMMVKDHTASTADLRAAAEQVDGVSVAPMLSARQLGELEVLKSAGESFDNVFKIQQRAAHKEALALLRTYAAAGDAPPLKAFAAKTAPVVETHLGHVEMLP